jgi:lysophospholipase L1-like esterase
VVGDSITGGVGSLNAVSPWWKYGLNNNFPVVQYAKAGIAAQGVAAAHQRGFPLLQGLTHALVLLGTNDYQNRSTTQLQADLTTIWTALANRGMKVYAGTLVPGTNTTDSWATTANQAPKTGDSTRIAVNDWIRSKPAPLTGFFDFADVCETARNSGLWKVNGTANYATSDGIHPSDAMHQLMGAAINTAVFTV